MILTWSRRVSTQHRISANRRFGLVQVFALARITCPAKKLFVERECELEVRNVAVVVFNREKLLVHIWVKSRELVERANLFRRQYIGEKDGRKLCIEANALK